MWVLAAAAGRANEEPELLPPFVPTVEEDVELMLDVAGVGPGDYVMDLGSGDGRIVIAAAQRGASGHGVEIDPELVAEATRRAAAAGVAARTAFVEDDIFETDLAAASVVTMYLYPEVNLRLRPKLLTELAPGTRVVSNSFDMGEWRPDVHDMSARSSGGILLWVVPADVAGDWRVELAEGRSHFTLAARQRFQDLDLELAHAGQPVGVTAAHLAGDRLEFAASAEGMSYLFNGHVRDGEIEGFVQIRGDSGTRVEPWRARRVDTGALPLPSQP